MKTTGLYSKSVCNTWRWVGSLSVICLLPSAHAFEGRITTALTRGAETETLFYTIGTNQMRIERGETNWPYARNIVSLDTGDVTILFPHNRSFVRLKPAAPNAPVGMPGAPGMPMPLRGLPPGVGPQSSPGDTTAVPPGPPPHALLGSTNLPGMPSPKAMPQMPQAPPGVGPQPGSGDSTMPGLSGGMAAMPVMPMPPSQQAELKVTDQTTNLLGFTCTLCEIKQRGEVMEIWVTDKLLPYQPYLQNQPHRFGARMLEEQWAELVQAKKLFPLLAVLKFENGPERLRFEVRAVKPQKIEDEDGSLFQPPPDYREIQPLPF